MGKRSSAEERRDTIKQAAYECFRDYGYHEASVDQICTRAGISKGSFYWHYPSKQDVYIELLESWAREMMDQVYDQFEDALRESDYISALKSSLLAETKRGHIIVPLWLEFTVLGQRDPEVRAAIARFYRRGRSAIAEMLRPWFRNTFSDEEISALASAALGTYIGVMTQAVTDPDGSEPRVIIDALMKIVDYAVRSGAGAVDGVAAQAEGASSDARWSPQQMEILVGHARPNVRALFQDWLQKVRAQTPGAKEYFVRGWKTLSWGCERRFVSLRADRDRVRLSFHEGVDLPDPQKLLHGSAKRMRFMILRPGQEVDEAAVFALIEAAMARVQ